MSISLKDFNSGNFDGRELKGSDTHPALIFLKKNKRAFKVKEICKKIGKKEDGVRGFLRKQIKKGIVVHKAPFFAYKR